MFLQPSAEPELLEDCSGWWVKSRFVGAGVEAGRQTGMEVMKAEVSRSEVSGDLQT